MRWPWMDKCLCSQGWREEAAGHGWPSVPVTKTQSGCLRLVAWPRLEQKCQSLEHRHGRLDAEMGSSDLTKIKKKAPKAFRV